MIRPNPNLVAPSSSLHRRANPARDAPPDADSFIG